MWDVPAASTICFTAARDETYHAEAQSLACESGGGYAQASLSLERWILDGATVRTFACERMLGRDRLDANKWQRGE
jgi:hypothetical protein